MFLSWEFVGTNTLAVLRKGNWSRGTNSIFAFGHNSPISTMQHFREFSFTHPITFTSFDTTMELSSLCSTMSVSESRIFWSISNLDCLLQRRSRAWQDFQKNCVENTLIIFNVVNVFTSNDLIYLRDRLLCIRLFRSYFAYRFVLNLPYDYFNNKKLAKDSGKMIFPLYNFNPGYPGKLVGS